MLHINNCYERNLILLLISFTHCSVQSSNLNTLFGFEGSSESANA